MSTAIKRIIFWDFPRASWQYDVVVALILIFIFFTPREFFRDQPKAQSIVLLPNEAPGQEVFYLEPKLLLETPEDARFQRAAALLERRDGKRRSLYRLTPIYDAEKDLNGFMAYTRVAK